MKPPLSQHSDVTLAAALDETPLIFVVDDDVSVREALELSMQSAGFRVETFASAEAFLDRPRAFVPSCLLLDLGLPCLDGLELQARLTDRSDLPIVFITGCDDVPTTVRAMKAGAFEFLTKPFDEELLAEAIRNAIDRSRAALAQQAELRSLLDRQGSLSRRERQVMALVVSGLLNKQVGDELGISEITVKAHRGQVMRKMKADSFAGLVTIAARLSVPPA
jgi:FixJ family two-component response regulator